jgi:hypothetical protein
MLRREVCAGGRDLELRSARKRVKSEENEERITPQRPSAVRTKGTVRYGHAQCQGWASRKRM